MTEEEVNKKFDKVEMRFHHYFKYNFTFTGKSEDGMNITAIFGGNDVDIYKLWVDSKESIPFANCAEWNYVSIHDENNKVFEKSNW